MSAPLDDLPYQDATFDVSIGEIAETIDQPVLLNQALQHLAVAQDAAKHPAAMATYEQALRLAREVGDEYGEALMLTNVGARLLAEGARRDAVEVLEHDLAHRRLAGTLRTPPTQASALALSRTF